MLSKRFAEYRRLGVTALIASLVAVAACDDDPLDPNDPSRFGQIDVTVTTAGYAPDFAEGYEVGLEGGGALEIDVNDEATLVGAPAGSNTVVLDGVPDHCTATNNPATVSVTAGQTAATTIAVTCTAVTGGITPVFTLTGAAEDLDTEVGLIIVDETEHDTLTDFLVDPAAPGELLHFLAGPHTVFFDSASVATNCAIVDPATATVDVSLGASTAATALTLDCVPNVGDLTVNIATSGVNLDDNYTLTIGEAAPVNVGVNGAAEFNLVRVGEVDVTLGDIAPNCTVAGGGAAGEDATETADIVFGEMAVVDFTVVCAE